MSGYRAQPLPDSQGRPIAPTTVSPQELAAAAEAEGRRIAERLEARAQRRAERERERQRLEHEAGQAALGEYRERARQAVMASGGSESDFTALWPSLRETYLREQAEAGLGWREREIARTKEELLAHARDRYQM